MFKSICSLQLSGKLINSLYLYSIDFCCLLESSYVSFSLLVLSSFLLVVSCGNDDLEPTLAMNKDSATGIQNAADLASVLNGAYDRMSSSGYYARNVIVNGEVRGDNF